MSKTQFRVSVRGGWRGKNIRKERELAFTFEIRDIFGREQQLKTGYTRSRNCGKMDFSKEKDIFPQFRSSLRRSVFALAIKLLP